MSVMICKLYIRSSSVLWSELLHIMNILLLLRFDINIRHVPIFARVNDYYSIYFRYDYPIIKCFGK